jgi:hypothetical protein
VARKRPIFEAGLHKASAALTDIVEKGEFTDKGIQHKRIFDQIMAGWMDKLAGCMLLHFLVCITTCCFSAFSPSLVPAYVLESYAVSREMLFIHKEVIGVACSPFSHTSDLSRRGQRREQPLDFHTVGESDRSYPVLVKQNMRTFTVTIIFAGAIGVMCHGSCCSSGVVPFNAVCRARMGSASVALVHLMKKCVVVFPGIGVQKHVFKTARVLRLHAVIL